jgi:hypothetical protein
MAINELLRKTRTTEHLNAIIIPTPARVSGSSHTKEELYVVSFGWGEQASHAAQTR